MKVTHITTDSGNIKEKLLPLLLNNVFHVTSEGAFKKIQKFGFINSNKDSTYPSNFTHKNWGTLNGMVCLIDLRQKTLSEAEEHLSDGYYFLRPKSDWKVVVFLLLNSAFHEDLKLQARFSPPRIGENYILMKDVCVGTYVPTECWYPKRISLDKISKAIVLEVQSPPPTDDFSLADILRKVFARNEAEKRN